jgi:hypothetical protein
MPLYGGPAVLPPGEFADPTDTLAVGLTCGST